MSAEHGHGHGSDEEYRVVSSMRERFKVMADVVGKSFKFLAGALLSILSFGALHSFEDSEDSHGGMHH